jgi:hypothetical protein
VRAFLCASALLFSGLGARVARADAGETMTDRSSPGRARHVLSLERALGMSYVASDDGRGDDGMGAVAPWSSTDTAVAAPFRVPRLAYDLHLGSFTLGVAGFAWSGSGKRSAAGPYVSENDVTNTVLGGAVRGGWLVCDAERLCFWGRAGLAVGHVRTTQSVTGYNKGLGQSESFDSSEEDTMISWELEPTLLIGLAPHFGLSATAYFDTPLAGHAAPSNGQGTKLSVWSAGTTVGLFGWL